MVTPDERRRILQAARDDQEAQANAAEELAGRQRDMSTFKADMSKHSASMTHYHTQIAGYSTELEQIDSDLMRLSHPHPVGAERSGDTSVLRGNNEAEQERLTVRRDEVLQLRRTASEAYETARLALEEAEGEWFIASAGTYLPEREVAQRERNLEAAWGTLAPPPAPERQPPSNEIPSYNRNNHHGNHSRGNGVGNRG